MVTPSPSSENTPRTSSLGYDLTPIDPVQRERWVRALTPEQERITQRAGTEAPFCGGLLDQKRSGVYACIVCGLPLFSDETKFDSGTGWPSFFAPVDPSHVARHTDSSHGMERVEILCARCDAHLGHVFPDGPPPTNERHCLNSDSLRFVPAGSDGIPTAPPTGFRRAYFAGGCFWGVEDKFTALEGVIDVVSGYQGGFTDNPTYELVSRGDTGHAESVEVIYDPSKVEYIELLQHFFTIHDASQEGGQGPDIGSQYRSAVFYLSEEERLITHSKIAELEDLSSYEGRTIVTQVSPAQSFWVAEEKHQDYYAKNGGSCELS